MSAKLRDRLTSPRLQRKAKKVTSWSGWFDSAGVGADAQLQDDLDDLIDLIIAGDEIPERYYRTSSGGDRLLKEEGIMHLHLRNPGSDVILYLVQFDEEVLLLGTGTHTELSEAYRSTWRARGAHHTPADMRAKKAAALATARLAQAEKRRAATEAAAIAGLKAEPRRKSASLKPPTDES
jgi:hypothetical protein